MKCKICSFDKKVEQHHIIKFMNYGSDEACNLVYLCPNHHYLADFGNTADKKKILREIKKKTGKVGSINKTKKEYFEKIIRTLIEDDLGEYTDKEYEKLFLESYNYKSYKEILMNRNNKYTDFKNTLLKRYREIKNKYSVV